MRIDLLITELEVGGAERCLTELAIGLTRRGFGVRVITIGPPPAAPRDELLQRLRTANIPFHSLSAASVWSAPAALLRLKRLFQADPPDVVQTFLHHANVLGTLAARLAKVPICFGGIRVAEPNPWRAFLERRISARMDRVVCVSEAVEVFARTRLVPEPVPTTIIPNSVELNRFTTATPVDWTQWDLPREADVALYIGRLEPQKGLEQLFAAAQIFLRGDANRWLVLAGDGSQKKWAQTVCDGMPGERARCIGWQPDVAELLAAARLLVLTSQYEGMPNVVLEAMASARPVVCFAVEGIEQIFSESVPDIQPVVSETGEPSDRSLSPGIDRAAAAQVIPRGETQRFAEAVSRFFSDARLRESIGRDNRTRVSERFSVDAMVDAYASLYRTAAQDAR